MLITRQMLEELKTPRNQPVMSISVYKEQIRVFGEAWPDGMETTLENCQQLVKLGISIEWLVMSLCPPEIWEAWWAARLPAQKALSDLEAKARGIYDDTVEPARKARDEDIDRGRAMCRVADGQVFYEVIQIMEESKED